MVDIFAIIGYIAIIAVISYVLFLLWKIRKWFIYRLMPHDMRATAMYEAIRDPDANERILLHKEFSGAVIMGQSLKRFIPAILIAAALVVAPAMYFYGPSIQGPFGVYDLTAPAIEDTFVSTSALNTPYGAMMFLRVGNVLDFTGFAFINDTTFGFVRVPRPDMGQNTSLYEIGMFRWIGDASSGSNGSFMMACPMTLNWNQDTFNFIEWALEARGALSDGILCVQTYVPHNYIGWVWWNMTGIMGTNDTIFFMQFPPLRNDWHAFDSTEGTRSPMIHTVYEGIGPPEKPLWMFGVYIAVVLIVGQVALLWLRKRKREHKRGK